MKRYWRNILEVMVAVALGLGMVSISHAGQFGGSRGSGGVSMRSHSYQSQTTNSVRQLTVYKPSNTTFTLNNSGKTTGLTHIGGNTTPFVQHTNVNPFIQHNIGTIGSQKLTVKTPVNLHLGTNQANLHLNPNLHVNPKLHLTPNLHLNGSQNGKLMSGKFPGLFSKNVSNPKFIKPFLFGPKNVSPFCSPFGFKCGFPFWNQFCSPGWWPCYSPFWSPWYCGCYSPYCQIGYPWYYSVGCWLGVNVAPYYTVQSSAAIDVELVDVRQIDAGDAQQKLGPAYRVTVRNNSAVDIVQSFSVGLIATTGRQLSKDLPMATAQVPGIKAGAIVTVDARLPIAAQSMGINYVGQPVPFAWLYTSIDAFEQLNDSNRTNNSAFQGRLDIPMLIVEK